MFTGIIEEIGSVRRVHRQGRGAQFSIAASAVTEGTKIGDSIAVNGVCLTVTELTPEGFTADAMPETLSKTALKQLKVRDSVHLERALRADSRLGGHFVTGHIDGVARVLRTRADGNSRKVSIWIPPTLMDWILPQGSIALDGVSLTVQRIQGNSIEVALIPETQRSTLFAQKRPGAEINVETDMLVKQAQKATRSSHGSRR